VCHHRFPNVVFANEEIDLARVFLLQVGESARMVNHRCVEEEVAHDEYSL
jgi:hypothetical protein